MMLASNAVVAFVRFAEETKEAPPNPVLPVGFEIFWSAILFFTLLALMRYVLLPPIMEGRDQRAARKSAGIDSVSDSETELAQINAVHQDRISAAKAEAAAIIDQARNESDGQRSEALAAVEEEIAKLRGNAQAEIDTARTAALSGARGSVSQLAVGAASKVLGRQVDASASQSVIDSYLGEGA